MTKPEEIKPAQLPPPIALMQLITGFWISSAVYVAAKLGLADHLSEGPVDSAELARRVGAHPAALYRLLRALASINVLTETEPHQFTLTPLGACLRSNVPGSLRAFAIVGREMGWESFGNLLHTVRTGETAFNHIHGKGCFDSLQEKPDLARLFDEAMTGFVTMNGIAASAAYDFSPFRTVVDVGGGRGAFMAAILNRNTGTRGIVFDRPEVVEGMKEKIAAEGLSDRCEHVGGDFFRSVPAGGDAYLLASVIHDWDDERALIILRNCRKVIPDRGKLLLVEMVIHEGNAPFFGKLLDLNMLVNFGGRERTAEEYGELLAVAGFRLVKIIQTGTPSSVIEAIPR